MKVLGIDSSMTNTGWMLTQVDHQSEFQWLDEVGRPICTYKRHTYLSHGTFKETKTKDLNAERIFRTAQKVQCLIYDLKPDLVVIEDTIGVGRDRSVTGVALFGAIMIPYLPSGRGQTQILHPTEGWINLSEQTSPMCVVSITPERIQSMVHGERSTKPAVVKERFRERSGYDFNVKFNDHEADAYFIAYHGTRFYLTCLAKVWPETILLPKEKEFFMLSKKRIEKRKKINGTIQKVDTGEWAQTSLLHSPGRFWWNLTQP